MWVYTRARDESGTLYTVGYYDCNGSWVADWDYQTRDEAAARINYLNGGFPMPHETKAQKSADMLERIKDIVHGTTHPIDEDRIGMFLEIEKLLDAE